MDGRSKALQGLLEVLTDKVKESREPLKAQEIGNALYGLQNMDGRSHAEQGLLEALTVKVKESREQLDAQAIGNALYGLQNMDGRSKALQGLLEVLTDKVKESRKPLKAQEIGNALYGLQNMDGSSHAEQGLLAALTDKVKESREQLDAQAIGNSLYGLQNMDGSGKVLQGLLAALTDKVKESKELLDAQAIGNALYGLQKMSGDVSEVFVLLDLLAPRQDLRKDSPLAWSQTISVYLELAKNSRAPILTRERFQYLLPDLVGRRDGCFAIEEITTPFVAMLKSVHFVDGQLDLHGLDHLSAIILLREGFKTLDGVKRIVFGASSHSKTGSTGRMASIVKIFLESHGMQGRWDFAAVELSPRLTSTPQAFFSHRVVSSEAWRTPDKSTGRSSVGLFSAHPMTIS